MGEAEALSLTTEDLQSVYLNKISECLLRLQACESFLGVHKESSDIFQFEAAVLQMRKSLECVAFAAVVTHKNRYAEFRRASDKSPDFTKDYHAKRIFKALSKINEDFYPIPLSQPIPVSPGAWHFERRDEGFLSKERFELFYDRLGRFLHADNPWRTEKSNKTLADDIPDIVSSVRGLLSYHVALIRTPEFVGAWFVESPLDGMPPRIIIARADGDFVVDKGELR